MNYRNTTAAHALAELFEQLKPTTLAAIVVDLEDHDGSGNADRYWLRVASLARAALVNNCGEQDAAELVTWCGDNL